MESMMEIAATFVAICMLGITVMAFMALTALLNWLKKHDTKVIDNQMAFDNLSKPLDILSKGNESESEDEAPFDAEEALSQMNEWERALCDKQRQAWEILNPGKQWKLTRYICQQVSRASMRKY
jgi:hypothetical protein